MTQRSSLSDVLDHQEAAEAAYYDMESVPRLTPWCSTGVGSPVMLMAGLEHVSCLMPAILCVSRRLPVAPGPGAEVGTFVARARVA